MADCESVRNKLQDSNGKDDQNVAEPVDELSDREECCGSPQVVRRKVQTKAEGDEVPGLCQCQEVIGDAVRPAERQDTPLSSLQFLTRMIIALLVLWLATAIILNAFQHLNMMP